jgi:hypothetical protein
MGLSAAWMAHRWIAQAASGLERVSSLATVILVGVAVYIACSYALKCEELSFLYRIFRERYVKT